KAEWAESDTRLRLIDGQGLGAAIERLGGAPILDRLRDAHRRYGEALGITTASEPAAAVANLRTLLAAFADALRHYIVRVVASVRKGQPATAAFARELLAPIENWEAPGASSKAPASPEAASE